MNWNRGKVNEVAQSEWQGVWEIREILLPLEYD